MIRWVESRGMCLRIPLAGASMQAASHGSSPARAPKTAAPDPAQLHGGLDLLGEVQHPPPAPSATPEPAASSEALRAQSDDSLVALGRGDQEKSLGLSGWNRDSSSMPGADQPESSARPETQPAQVAHLTPTTLLLHVTVKHRVCERHHSSVVPDLTLVVCRSLL